MRNLDLRDYLKIIVPKPGVNEQHRIADAISNAHDYIASLEEEIRRAENVRRSLVSELFEERIKGRATNVGKLLREPIKNGYSPVCVDYETGVWVLGLDAVSALGFNPDAKKAAPKDDPKLQGNELKPGDIVVSRSNTRQLVGLSGLYLGDPNPCFYPDLLMRIRVDLDAVRPRFLSLFLRSQAARRWINSRAGGTSGSMVKIKERDIRQMPIILPGMTEQDRTIETMQSVSDLQGRLRTQQHAALRLKVALLQNLLTGKVRMKP